MGRNLEVVLEEPSRRWRGGETVRGEVVVEVEKDTKCTSLDVEIGWSTHGRGNRASDDLAYRQLFAGQWSPGTYRYAFEFELPHGPYSYNGHYLNVGWFIEARADVPWAFDPKDEVELWLEPSPEPLPLGHPALEVSTPAGVVVPSGALFVGAFVFMGFAAVLVAIAMTSGEFGGFVFALFVGIIGIVITVFAVRSAMVQGKFGEIEMSVEPVETFPGGQMLASLAFTPKADATLNGVTLTMKAYESVTSGSGTNRTTYTHSIYDQTYQMSGACEVRKGEPFRLEHALVVPDEAPLSFEASDNKLRWEVEVAMDVHRWPDWKGSSRLWVGPARQQGW